MAEIRPRFAPTPPKDIASGDVREGASMMHWGVLSVLRGHSLIEAKRIIEECKAGVLELIRKEEMP